MTEVRVEGGREVAAALRSFGREVAGDLTGDVLADRAADALRTTVPVRSGTLRGSVRAESSPGRAAAVADTAYAGVIDNGWAGRNISASHFRARADRQLQDASRVLGAGIDRIIRQNGLNR